jgi:hypothetical protein
LRSTQRLCQKVLEGKLTLDAMSEADFANELYTAEIGDPDLLFGQAVSNAFQISCSGNLPMLKCISQKKCGQIFGHKIYNRLLKVFQLANVALV